MTKNQRKNLSGSMPNVHRLVLMSISSLVSKHRDNPMYLILFIKQGRTAMSTHNIRVADYLHACSLHNLNDDTTEEEHKYYLVLDISDNAIDAISFCGSPLPTQKVFEFEEIQKDFSISIIEDVKSEYVYRSYTSRYGKLHRQEYIGTKYFWNDKTVTIPSSNIYYSGNGVWREKTAAEF